MATGTITSLGIGSSLDLQGILDSLRKADETSITLKQQDKTNLEATKNEFNTINAKLLSMKSNALSLSLGSNFLDRSVSISSSDVISASVATGTDANAYSATVNRLTSSSSFTSAGKAATTNTVYVPTVQKSSTGFDDTNAAIVLAEDEVMTMTYGYGSNIKSISITGEVGGSTLDDIVTLIANDTENDGGASTYLTATTFQDTTTSKYHLQIAPTSGGTGEDNRVMVTYPPATTGFSADAQTFSYTMGDSSVISLSIISDTSLASLVTQINDDENNPGVTASIINTGSGDTPYRLLLTADASGESSRIDITSQLSDLAMTEINGSDYSMKSDTTLSFTSLTFDASNNNIDFEEFAPGTSGQLTATIPIGEYKDMDALATAIETAMEGVSTNSVDYNVTYSATSAKFTIQALGSTLSELRMLWASGANTATTAASILGHSVADDTGATNYTSDGTISLSSTPIIIRTVDNNTDIVFQEDDGNGYTSDITATIATGVYNNGNDLATAVEKALETASATSGGGKDYSVTFNNTTSKLEIQEAGTLTNLKILWSEAGSTAASALGFDATDETITPADSSLNASITVDGIEYQRTKNTGLTDIISGVTLSLIGQGNATLNITEDTTAIKKNITSLITTFNDIITEIDTNDDFDEDTETWGSLAKTTSIRSAKDVLLNLLGTEISINSTIKTYYDLGFEVAKDGSVSLDETILDNMITSNFAEIKTLFTGTTAGSGVTGIGDLLNNQIKNYTQASGLIDSETDALDDRISRLEEQIETATERLDKRYETMAQQFVRLDSYMRQMESQQNYVSQIFSALEKKE